MPTSQISKYGLYSGHCGSVNVVETWVKFSLWLFENTPYTQYLLIKNLPGTSRRCQNWWRDGKLEQSRKFKVHLSFILAHFWACWAACHGHSGIFDIMEERFTSTAQIDFFFGVPGSETETPFLETEQPAGRRVMPLKKCAAINMCREREIHQVQC